MSSAGDNTPEAVDSAAAASAMTTTTKSNPPFRVSTIGEAVDAAAKSGSGTGEEGGEDEGIEGLDEIKHSLCMNCGGDGTTRMLTTAIPFFREVILSSFECDTCGWRNNEASLTGAWRRQSYRCMIDAGFSPLGSV